MFRSSAVTLAIDYYQTFSAIKLLGKCKSLSNYSSSPMGIFSGDLTKQLLLSITEHY